MISPADIFLRTHSALARLLQGNGVPTNKPDFVDCFCPSASSASSCSNPLQDLQDRLAAWQAATFPHQSLDGKLAHLRREITELRASPGDPMEWADVFLLIVGSAAKAGLTIEDLRIAAELKFAIVQNRQWGPADSEGVHHHL